MSTATQSQSVEKNIHKKRRDILELLIFCHMQFLGHLMIFRDIHYLFRSEFKHTSFLDIDCNLCTCVYTDWLTDRDKNKKWFLQLQVCPLFAAVHLCVQPLPRWFWSHRCCCHLGRVGFQLHLLYWILNLRENINRSYFWVASSLQYITMY